MQVKGGGGLGGGAEPVLASGRDGQITLFGELPELPVEEHEMPAAVSLRLHSEPSEGSDFDPALDRTGQRIVFASTRHSLSPDLYYKDVDGVAVSQLTSDPAADVQPCFSPDGGRVAFASNRSGNWDIWIINIDGQHPIQITTSAAHEVHPSWSPDGSHLVFCSLPQRGGHWELWISSAEAGSVKKFIGYGLFPEWAPNSDTIVYQRARRRGARWFSLWTLKLVQGEPRMPTEVISSSEYSLILPTWSPDGQQIAYCSVQSVGPSSREPDGAGDATMPDEFGSSAGRNNAGGGETVRPRGNAAAAGARRASGGLDQGGGPAQRADIWMVDADGRGQVRLTGGTGANYSPNWSTEGRIFFTSDRCSEDGSKECIWSVTPLQAPMATREDETHEVLSRDDPPRPDESMRVLRPPFGRIDPELTSVPKPAPALAEELMGVPASRLPASRLPESHPESHRFTDVPRVPMVGVPKSPLIARVPGPPPMIARVPGAPPEPPSLEASAGVPGPGPEAGPEAGGDELMGPLELPRAETVGWGGRRELGPLGPERLDQMPSEDR